MDGNRRCRKVNIQLVIPNILIATLFAQSPRRSSTTVPPACSAPSSIGLTINESNVYILNYKIRRRFLVLLTITTILSAISDEMLAGSATKHYIRRWLTYRPFYQLTPSYPPLSRDGKQDFQGSRRTPPSGDALALTATTTTIASMGDVAHCLSLLCLCFFGQLSAY